MDRKQEIILLIKTKGQRVTKQKEMVIDILLENQDKMLSVADIREKVKGKYINNATIYRNIQSFLAMGILETMIDSKGVSRYVINNGEHQHHLICTECGKIISFPCNNPFWKPCMEAEGFQESWHKIEVYGICAQCRKTTDIDNI